MNRLAEAASPYLRQHADNPVDWWPWGAEALALARARDVPILLSIGYSACHWCHVMARESFADPLLARQMNEWFVCIKVDREERPDLDRVYQLAHHALTGRAGGWPLTVFLTPDDHLPFFAGTYFPREPRYGMPSFGQVLREVRRWWDERRAELRAQNAALAEFLREAAEGGAPPATALDEAPLDAALERIAQQTDPLHGGHRGAPKFPPTAELALLLELERYDAVAFTLARMAAGGIHDQLGGGFFRYSVDERWEIPHFEKMLYDNAGLLPLYAEAARHTGREDFAGVARELLAWLLREMHAPDGGFCSALDADSEHEEGKYYLWQREEVRSLQSAEEFAVAEAYFGFDRPANFEGRAWHPIAAASIEDIACRLGLERESAMALLREAKRKLFAARAGRVAPARDDKILTAWNALLIGGLARAARALDAPALGELAVETLDFLYQAVWRADGRLWAKAGVEAERFPAYLDDHAFLLDALLEVLQCRFHERDLAWAIVLAEQLLARFEDRDGGGFFFTAHDHERLIQRPKTWTDEALPAGNGIAARALLRLASITGESRYRDAAERTLHAAYPTMQRFPEACATLLRALHDFLRPRPQLVVRFASAAEQDAWRAALANVPLSRLDVYFVPAGQEDLPGMLAAQRYATGGVAYLCHGSRCLPAIVSPAALAETLGDLR
jgi:hypothetical protein